jgi:hypothetical protein
MSAARECVAFPFGSPLISWDVMRLHGQVTSAIEAKWGGCIHVLVNNAALFVFKSVEVRRLTRGDCERSAADNMAQDATAEDWDRSARQTPPPPSPLPILLPYLPEALKPQREHQGPRPADQSHSPFHKALRRRQHRVAGKHFVISRAA